MDVSLKKIYFTYFKIRCDDITKRSSFTFIFNKLILHEENIRVKDYFDNTCVIGPQRELIYLIYKRKYWGEKIHNRYENKNKGIDSDVDAYLSINFKFICNSLYYCPIRIGGFSLINVWVAKIFS